jgi:hypothetical protein
VDNYWKVFVLTEKDCDYWAKMDYWDIDEALLLSRGISPDKWNNNLNEPYLNQEHMDIVTDDINNRFKILKKALNFNGIYYREIPCLYDGE